MPPGYCHELGGGIGTAEDDQVIFAPARLQVVGQGFDIGPVKDLHPLALQVGDIGLGGLQIGGGEGHLETPFSQEREEVDEPQGAGFLVRGGHIQIDNQGPPPYLPLLLPFQILAPHPVMGQDLAPAFEKLVLVDGLEAFHARLGSRIAIPARRHPL
jgi:hypothetical protein